MFCYVVAFYLLRCSLATCDVGESDLKIKWKFDAIVSEERESRVDRQEGGGMSWLAVEDI
jgi:hypothetical protein